MCVRFHGVKDQQGVSGLETALVLIAFVVVSSVFAFAALSTGLLSSDSAKGSFLAGLSGARGSLSLRGNVIAQDTDTDGYVDKLSFQVANGAGGEAIDLTPGRTMLRYSDARQSRLFDTASMFSVTPMGTTDSDYLLESGELYELALLDMETNLTSKLAKNTTFAIEVLAPQGAVLHLERTTPVVLRMFNDLIGGGVTKDKKWWSRSWLNRVKITFNNLDQSEPLTDFPLLVSLTSDSVDYTKTQDAGQDIRFVDSDDSTELSHEIEKWDESATSTVWVKVPQIDGGSNADYIWMYYNHSSVADGQNAADVWSNGYEAVYHLNDDFLDSTSNARNATNDGSDDVTGQFADAQDFTPLDELNLGTWSVTGTALTIQAWAYFDDFEQDDPRIISKAIEGDTHDHVFMLSLSGEGERYLRMRIKTGESDGSGTKTLLAGEGALTAQTWHMVTGRYDGSTMRLYKDGSQVASTSKTGSLRENSWQVWAGNNPNNANNAEWGSMDGRLDEIRISSVARSADWLAAQYKSHTNTFFGFSAEESL